MAHSLRRERINQRRMVSFYADPKRPTCIVLNSIADWDQRDYRRSMGAGTSQGRLGITGQVEQKSGQVTGQDAGQVEPWIPPVLRLCESSPRSSREIQAVAGIKHRESFQRNYLDLLLSRTWLERTIPDKPQSRLQKYRLTAAGLAILNANEGHPPAP